MSMTSNTKTSTKSLNGKKLIKKSTNKVPKVKEEVSNQNPDNVKKTVKKNVVNNTSNVVNNTLNEIDLVNIDSTNVANTVVIKSKNKNKLKNKVVSVDTTGSDNDGMTQSDQPPSDNKQDKRPKKFNDKPTLSDICGLNLSVAKVKNIISNLCINKAPFMALKELRDNKVNDDTNVEVDDSGKKQKKNYTFVLDGLSQNTLDYLEVAQQSFLDYNRELHSKKKVKNMSEENRKSYNDARKNALANHLSSTKDTHLFKSNEFDLLAFNTTWDKNFYSDMDVVDWKSLQNKELYEYCTNIVNKMKVRFNSESKVFVTAFIECIVKQLVVNGTVNCVQEGKKIIKLEHALQTTNADFKELFSLYPLITHLPTFTQYKENQLNVVDTGEVSTENVDSVDNVESMDDDHVDRKYKFNHYVSELCRTVKNELSRKDKPNNETESNYYTTSVSKVFKVFCSNLIVELIKVFGELLKIEVNSRNIKTVNYNVIHTLLQLVHTVHGLNNNLENTVEFIQEQYSVYQKFLENRKDKKGDKLPLDDEDLETEVL